MRYATIATTTFLFSVLTVHTKASKWHDSGETSRNKIHHYGAEEKRIHEQQHMNEGQTLGQLLLAVIEEQLEEDEGTQNESNKKVSKKDLQFYRPWSGCGNAISIEIGESATGNTENASPTTMFACGASGGPTGRTGGLWYKVVGNGETLWASTCDPGTGFDTQMSVFGVRDDNHDSDDNDCNSLECIDGGDDDPNCPSAGTTSTVMWDSEVGENYYVLVYGYGYEEGSFTLTVSDEEPEVSPASGGTSGATAAQFSCDSAVPVELDVPVEGSTASQSEPASYDAYSCGESNPSSSPGNWYSIVGNGDYYQASTCLSATFDTQIAVFTSSDCSETTCIDGNDDSTCAPFSTVEWETVEGETYYILVNGYGDSAGEYTLEVTTAEPPIPPTGCEDAIEVTIGDTVSGSTESSDATHMFTCQGASDNIMSGGNWYVVEGNGGTLSASTCSSGTEFDTQLSVWAAGDATECGELTCVDGNDDYGICEVGGASTVEWDSEQGETYYILVFGFLRGQGDYELTVIDASA